MSKQIMIKPDMIREQFLKAFGKRMRKLRKSLGKECSQEHLSRITGLHRNYISDAERGARNISLVALFKIINGLNCSFADFFAEGFDQILEVNEAFTRLEE